MSTLYQNRAGRRAAFTLIEVTIVVTILGVILTAVGVFQATSQKSSNSMIAHADVERRADRALREIMEALRDASVHTLAPDPTSAFGTNSLTFRTPSAVSAVGDVTFGAPSRIELRLDDGELDNGLDDNGDGVIDERALVLTRGIGTANARAVTICHGISESYEGETPNAVDDNANGIVDESGFCVRRVGDLFFLYLTLEARSREGERILYATNTALALRN